MREFLKWLREQFSIRTFGAILLVFISLLCVWVPGIILATRFYAAYIFAVSVPDFATILFPLGRLGAVLMVFCFSAFSVYFVYARDTKWDKDDIPPADGE